MEREERQRAADFPCQRAWVPSLLYARWTGDSLQSGVATPTLNVRETSRPFLSILINKCKRPLRLNAAFCRLPASDINLTIFTSVPPLQALLRVNHCGCPAFACNYILLYSPYVHDLKNPKIIETCGYQFLRSIFFPRPTSTEPLTPTNLVHYFFLFLRPIYNKGKAASVSQRSSAFTFPFLLPVDIYFKFKHCVT